MSIVLVVVYLLFGLLDALISHLCCLLSAMTTASPSANAKYCTSNEAAQSIETAFELDIEQINFIAHHVLKQLRKSLLEVQFGPHADDPALRTPPAGYVPD